MNNPKSQSLANYKSALRYNDKETAKYYLDKYKSLGGTDKGLKTSLATLDPLSGLNAKDRKAFIDSLNGEEKKELEKAIQYYKSVLSNK